MAFRKATATQSIFSATDYFAAHLVPCPSFCLRTSRLACFRTCGGEARQGCLVVALTFGIFPTYRMWERRQYRGGSLTVCG